MLRVALRLCGRTQGQCDRLQFDQSRLRLHSVRRIKANVL
jgi:hypothetical protein